MAKSKTSPPTDTSDVLERGSRVAPLRVEQDEPLGRLCCCCRLADRIPMKRDLCLVCVLDRLIVGLDHLRRLLIGRLPEPESARASTSSRSGCFGQGMRACIAMRVAFGSRRFASRARRGLAVSQKATRARTARRSQSSVLILPMINGSTSTQNSGISQASTLPRSKRCCWRTFPSTRRFSTIDTCSR